MKENPSVLAVFILIDLYALHTDLWVSSSFSVFKIEGQIWKSVNKEIYKIYQYHANCCGQCRSEGGKEERVQFEKHIVRVYPRKVDCVCHGRYAKRRDGGDKEIA